MAITQRYKNMDAYFRFTEGDKLIINDLSYIDSKDMDFIHTKLTTVYDNATISTIPTCDCGALKSKYLLGVECQECSTVCTDPRDSKQPYLWFGKLQDNLPFINPAFWNSLITVMPGKLDGLRWLSDPTYNPPVNIPNYLLLINKDIMDNTRSYATMLERLPQILDYLVVSPDVTSKSGKSDIVKLRHYYAKYQRDILSTYLPLPNKKQFVIENTTKGKYTNLVLGDAIDIVTNWLRNSTADTPAKKQGIATATLIHRLVKMYNKQYGDFLVSKQGSFRKHVYGGRSHFTFRTVISAETGKHRINEIVPPWVVLVTVFRPHVLNKLIRRGYSYMDADRLLTRSISVYSPIIDEIQQELISESPYEQGIPCILNRNPSLHQSSALLMYIPRFNIDPKTLVTTLSPLVAKMPNADFDQRLVIK